MRAELARMDTEVLAAEARLSASGASDLGDLLVRVEQLRERARGLTAVLPSAGAAWSATAVQLMDASVAASLEAEAARLRSEQAAVAEAQAALEPDVAALEADEEAAAEAAPWRPSDDLADGTSTDDGTAGRPDTTRRREPRPRCGASSTPGAAPTRPTMNGWSGPKLPWPRSASATPDSTGPWRPHEPGSRRPKRPRRHSWPRWEQHRPRTPQRGRPPRTRARPAPPRPSGTRSGARGPMPWPWRSTPPAPGPAPST